MFFFLVFSCSTDNNSDDDVAVEESPIIGFWKFTDIETSSTTIESVFVQAAIIGLVESGCDIATLDFNNDMTLETTVALFENEESYTECPKEVASETTVWKLDGDQLSFVDEELTTQTITIELTEYTLIVPSEVFEGEDVADLLPGSSLIFTKE
ncbi:hypothetical protein KO500_12275 [Cellulophaga baltica]|uniref:hypothetical protein n=1 Tax=Cellulophaga TaxID=104264 RepID=UPI001C0777A5|nr:MULTISPECIES: hypothetical protein [Cellulophaga]MBU2997216.1 hypothetical protein [Cellulophaga baltica]MDO6768614.1 hypothetical protein [Cellulophaga sp. 1_MG-2023]